MFVPLKVGYVRIIGQVLNPGYYPYVEGKDVQHYLDNAGGFLSTAVTDEVGIYNPISKTVSTNPLKAIVADGSEIRARLREELK